jgi:preprotein translocase subunit YajC
VEGAVQLLWLVLFVVAFWLLLIRPQRKRQRQLMEMQGSVDVGDEVMLSAGVFARVTGELDDPAAGDCLLVELAPGVEVKIARGAVVRVVQPPLEDHDEMVDTDEVADTDATEGHHAHGLDTEVDRSDENRTG